MYDLIIKNGSVLDGTGCDAVICDIAVKDGVIAKIGANLSGAEKVIDASGLTVTPGFIDSHSHGDGALIKFPELKEKVEQGITTHISGQCGGSPAPSKNAETGTVKTMGEYLDRMADKPIGSSTMIHVGHNSLRRVAMGNENRAPTEAEMQCMKELLADAMEHGALGLSFGLGYTPGCFAKTDELIELAKVAAQYGGIVSAHTRSEGEFQYEAITEFIEVLRQSGARGVISHHKASRKQYWGKVRASLAAVDAAVEEGIDVYSDVYPYTAFSTGLAATLIPIEHRAGAAADLDHKLDDPAFREMMKSAWLNVPDDDLSWILMVICSNHREYDGLTIPQIAALRNQSPYDAAFDLIQECHPTAKGCFFTMCEEDVQTVMAHPRTMICTDSSVAMDNTVYHPRLRGSFPRALGRYVRQMKTVTLPEMIRKMTSLPAQVYGIPNKGLLREGYDADICIFDADKIIDRAEFTDCQKGCEGLNFVIVGGEVVAEDGVHNGKCCGRIILRK